MEFIKEYELLLSILTIIGIELSPIKINPLEWLGDMLNKSLKQNLDQLKNEIDEIKYQQDMSDLGVVRNRILSLYRIQREGMTLTPDDLSSVEHDLDRYMYLKEKYQYMIVNGKKVKINGEIDLAIKNLLK